MVVPVVVVVVFVAAMVLLLLLLYVVDVLGEGVGVIDPKMFFKAINAIII